jgi:hypothetical protein
MAEDGQVVDGEYVARGSGGWHGEARCVKKIQGVELGASRPRYHDLIRQRTELALE